MTQNELGLPQGTIKATVLIETILATFEMDEILYELREHQRRPQRRPLGLHLLVHQEVQGRQELLPRRPRQVTMTAPFMRAYALLLLKTCHKRGAPAIGGMSALIPIKNDPAANEKALAGDRARQDARRHRRLRRRLGRAPGPGPSRDEGVRQGARRPAEPVGQAARRRQRQRRGPAQLPARDSRSPRPACA